MDAYEATKIVFSRIQSLDPENAVKIMGILLIQDHGEKEMIRLAFGPESLLQSLVFKAHKDLGLLARPPPPPPPPPLAVSSPSSWTAAGEEFIDELQLQAGEDIGWAHRCFAADPWKPCLYYARGYCKNGASCRFLHEEAAAAAAAAADRSKSLRFMSSGSAGFPYSPTGPLSPSPKCVNMNFLLQQQRSEGQRAAVAAAAAAAAAALMMGGEDPNKFIGRPKIERNDFSGMMSPVSRQIYLTFPADSTFREEDVSNYFSIYGPVQDVRIPYQQKRMFGFVTFLYPETVKLILAKGNPHFVCDARVLVKPYKEKGKIPDKYSRKQQGDRGDFSGCTTPTGLESRDPFDLQQLRARMLYSSNNQDVLLRRKLEEQRELQQAIELQHRRFMGLQLIDLKRNSMASPTFPIKNALEEDKNSIFAGVVARADKEETSSKDGDFQESAEHNLPDSPFASPTKMSFAAAAAAAGGGGGGGGDYSSFASDADPSSSSSSLFSSTLLPATSFKSCFFQMPPRFPSGHGAIGL